MGLDIELVGGPHGGRVVPNPHGHLPDNVVLYDGSKGQNPWPVMSQWAPEGHKGFVYYERTGKATAGGNQEYEYAWTEE